MEQVKVRLILATVQGFTKLMVGLLAPNLACDTLWSPAKNARFSDKRVTKIFKMQFQTTIIDNMEVQCFPCHILIFFFF